MSLLVVKNVSRIYKNEFTSSYALKNFTYYFPSTGLVSISGKSGSGKSTLLNMISLIDKPSEGTIYFNNKNLNLYKEKEINRFRNNNLGIIFQNYNLFDDESVLFNIEYPLLVKGKSFSEAKRKATNLFTKLNLKKELLNQKCKNLSGGEKQRVAILRAIINDPEIILCDEPTGALDSENTYLIMDLIKEISKTHLVIMVSHNNEVVKSYSDEIIYLKDGEIYRIEVKSNNKSLCEDKNRKRSGKTRSFLNFIQGFKLIKKKITKNIISSLSLSFGLISSILIFGFSHGYKEAVINSSYQQIDYGVLRITHEEISDIKGSKISLIKEARPNKKEIIELENEYKDIKFFPNISYFFPQDIDITCGEENIDKTIFSPLYCFDNELLDESLLIQGRFPNNNRETIINKSAYNLLKKNNANPLGLLITIKSIKEVSFITGKEDRPVVTDYFDCQSEVEIVGVVDDFNFITSPKIYYSYLDNVNVLKNYRFNNLSDYLGEEISMYDYLLSSSDNSELSSYSYVGFYLNKDNYPEISKICEQRKDKLNITSLGRERGEACLELINACVMGMDIFLIISIIGTVLIIGIISFSSFSEDKRKIAIMYSLGTSRESVTSIYLYSNIFISLLSLSISFIASLSLKGVINTLIYKFVGIENVIDIPFLSFMNIRFLFPILITFIVFIIIYFSTYIPIYFSSKISLKEELKEE